jgi:hypothetical protein
MAIKDSLMLGSLHTGPLELERTIMQRGTTMGHSGCLRAVNLLHLGVNMLAITTERGKTVYKTATFT